MDLLKIPVHDTKAAALQKSHVRKGEEANRRIAECPEVIPSRATQQRGGTRTGSQELTTAQIRRSVFTPRISGGLTTYFWTSGATRWINGLPPRVEACASGIPKNNISPKIKINARACKNVSKLVPHSAARTKAKVSLPKSFALAYF